MVKKTVEFEHEIDEEVITPFGEVGIVDMLGFDDGGKKYFVKTSNSGKWFKESALKDKPAA